MDKAKDKKLYKLVSDIVKAYYPKHSIYRSMMIIDFYKNLGGEFKDDSKSKGTTEWLLEKWKNLTPYALNFVDSIEDCPPCGKKHPKQGKFPSICRPTVKVNSKTPKIAQSFSRKQIYNALKQKIQGNYIQWEKL